MIKLLPLPRTRLWSSPSATLPFSPHGLEGSQRDRALGAPSLAPPPTCPFLPLLPSIAFARLSSVDISWGGGEESKEGTPGKRRGWYQEPGTPESKGVWARGAAKCREEVATEQLCRSCREREAVSCSSW